MGVMTFSTLNASYLSGMHAQHQAFKGVTSPYAASVAQSQKAETVRFGFQKSTDFQLKELGHVKYPEHMMPDLWPLSEALADNIKKVRRGRGDSHTLNQIQRQSLDIFRLYNKIQKELRYSGIPYLPENKRQQVNKFRRSFRYLVLRFILPRSTQRRLIILQGPAAIKRAQEEYQLTEKLANDMGNQIGNLKKLPGLSLGQRFKRFQILMVMRFLQLRMKWIISTNKPLGNSVPG